MYGKAVTSLPFGVNGLVIRESDLTYAYFTRTSRLPEMLLIVSELQLGHSMGYAFSSGVRMRARLGRMRSPLSTCVRALNASLFHTEAPI